MRWNLTSKDDIRWKEHAANAALSEVIFCNLLNMHNVATSPIFDEYQKINSIQREILTKLTPAFAEAMLLWLWVRDQTVALQTPRLIFLKFQHNKIQHSGLEEWLEQGTPVRLLDPGLFRLAVG